jgi:hypothetical protein
MKPEDLAKSFSFLFDSLLDWATAVSHPLETGHAILRDNDTSLDAIRVATNLWVTASLLSAVLQLPLYELQGISWTNIGFHLSTGLILLSILMLGNLSLYGGLRHPSRSC